MMIHDDPDGFPMISGLFGPPTEFRLSVGPWQECEPLGGLTPVVMGSAAER